jgi:preprotein translocase subunit SecA
MKPAAQNADFSYCTRWCPCRNPDEVSRWDWSENLRWCRHRLGLVRRGLHRELDEVQEQVRRLEALGSPELKKTAFDLHCRWRRIHCKTGPEHVLARRTGVALATVAAERTVGMSPFPVQLLASLALLERCAVQMSPGEGKTLSIAVAAVLNGWAGPCHIFTANDYLARRDAESMGPLYRFCGLDVSFVDHEAQGPELSKRYQADIVYGTGKQMLADYLRDKILLEGAVDPQQRLLWELRSRSRSRPVMRGLFSAIIDEADSVLIDEAITPLIISGQEDNPMLLESALTAREMVDELVRDEDYVIDELFRDVHFSSQGEARLKELTSKLSPLWQTPERRHDLISQAIIARDLFEKDRHYVVEDGKIVIVDENTGRVMPGRSWSYGMHQAVEAREGVELTNPSKTLARMSFQEFFRRYHFLSGASGTLHGIRGELWSSYRLPVFRVPTRLTSLLKVSRHLVFQDREEKLQAIVHVAANLHQKGCPVLLGTRRIQDSEILAEILQGLGINCEVLNAKHYDCEAEIVAMAGQAGMVTVSTNMAGRGTDIKLGMGVEKRGGLRVLMFESHESARVDWQLFGRAGRQGAPGHAQPFAALDEDLLNRHLPALLKPMLWSGQPSFCRRFFLPLLLWIAQQRAQWRAWIQRRRLQRREKEVSKQLSFTSDKHGTQDMSQN